MQVLVYHDVLGMMTSPSNAKAAPRFCKQYAQIGTTIHNALSSFKQDVEGGNFPDQAHSPYKIAGEEVAAFVEDLKQQAKHDVASDTQQAVEWLKKT